MKKQPGLVNGEWWVGKKAHRWPRPLEAAISAIFALVLLVGGIAHQAGSENRVHSQGGGVVRTLDGGVVLSVGQRGEDGCITLSYEVCTTRAGPNGQLVEEVHPLVDTYSSAGSTSWAVPAGVFSIAFDVSGAGGGAAGARNQTGSGGAGGRVTGTIAVTPGQSITITVGGGGSGGSTGTTGGNTPVGGAGGYNGGAAGGSGTSTGFSNAGGRCGGGGGGGRSEIAVAGTTHIIAGGGGGSGASSTTGAGGAGGAGGSGNASGSSGGNGQVGGSSGGAGNAGSGGSGGTGNPSAGLAGTAGGSTTGGTGGHTTLSDIQQGGGGGGGGYGGGGGGGGDGGNTNSKAGGGGGGGSYASGSVTGVGGGTGSAGGTSTAGTAGNPGTAGVNTLTYTVNAAPTQPGAFTEPDLGVTYNASISVAWGASTDAEGNPFTYSLYYSIGGGSQVLIASGIATNSYVWNCSGAASSTAYRLHVYAVQSSPGVMTSAVRDSDLFTIQHNTAPNPATPTFPISNQIIDIAITNRFTFTPNDPDVGDTKIKHDIRYRIVGAGSWTTITNQVNGNNYHDFVGSTFTAGSYEWQVLTYDSQGVAATDWSTVAYFTAAAAPAVPSITSPANNGTIATSNSLVVWTAPAQTDFQVRRVADAAGSPNTSIIYYDSGTVAGVTPRDHALTFATNNRYEHVQVRIKNNGLWSSWASVRVQVNYTPPAAVVLVLDTQSENGRIGVTFANPVPVGVEPSVTENWLYRRIDGETEWVLIAEDIANDGVYLDYATADGVIYEYMSRTWGNNGTFIDSASYEATALSLRGSWLHAVSDPDGTAYQFLYNNEGGSEDYEPELVLTQMSGRQFPIAEYGESEAFTASASISLDGREEMDVARAFARMTGEMLCYRDHSGRKVFGIIPTQGISSTHFGGTTVLEIVALQHDEAVG